MAAASPDVIRPSSGISAISMAAETGPIPGMDRRSRAFGAVGVQSRQLVGRVEDEAIWV
jgi:hypothetical protein